MKDDIKREQLTLEKTNRLMRSGRLAEALLAYRRLQIESPHLERMVSANLHLIEGRLRRTQDPDVFPDSEHLEARNEQRQQTGATSAKKLSLGDLYRTIDGHMQGKIPSFTKECVPLVSIVVTSHNTAEYIEACLQSLLMQSYPNTEIIVVDDASSDATSRIVERVARANGGITLYQLNTNLGTYYAKNVGILRSKGHVLFFQDSDDISHPHRISLQMQELLSNPAALVVRGAYSRIDPVTERVIPVNGLISKLGLITLGVRRSVFDQLGYFNCTTKASDDEFLNRVLNFLGKGVVVNLDTPLYYNTMREGSLFADMVSWKADGSIEQKPSASRQAYVNSYKETHVGMDPSRASRTFQFPRLRDAVPVVPEMTKLANPEVPVTISVCSIPEREAKLERALRSIDGQCDTIFVYLDRYEREPPFLKRLRAPVTVWRSQELPGLRDNGKFIALEQLLAAQQDAYYFMIDDDIEYPIDYVNAMIKAIQAFDDEVAVGVHGVTLMDHPKGYFSDRRIVDKFSRGLEQSRLVNVLGTGTTAFRARLFKGFALASFAKTGMADIYFAIECRRRALPQICLARHDQWLKDLTDMDAPSLYSEFKAADEPQSQLLKQFSSWGMEGIEQTLAELAIAKPSLHHKLHDLRPVLRCVTRSAGSPNSISA